MKSEAFVYSAQGKVDSDGWVRQYLPLVRRIAQHLIARLPANVELDDLIQAGVMGLMDAVGRFEESQGVAFEAFASTRIRGAMLDELRAGDWLPRSARKSQRDIENAVHRLEGRLKRAPSEAEIARELGLPIDEYQRVLSDARGAQLVHFDDLGPDGDDDYLERHIADVGGDPLALLRNQRFGAALAKGIDDLPEREKLVMSLYYEQDMNLKEIGAVLGVTESRVCQLHSQAVARLRARLRDW